MTWSFKLTDSNNLLVTASSRTSTNLVVNTNISVSGALNAIEFYATNMASGDNRQPYFNNLQISQGDATPPEVTISNRLVALAVNTTYTPSAASATDNVDGAITTISNNSAAILTSSARSTPNTYTVTYSATDAAGNTGTATQTVVVYDPAVGFASQYTSVAAPGTYAFTAGWSPDGTNNTALVKVANFHWALARHMTNRGNFTLKFAANGNWDIQWGVSSTAGTAQAGGDVIPFSVPTTGIYTLAFNESTLAYSVARATTNGLTFAQWAAQYGLAADSQAGGGDLNAGGDDFLTNLEEYIANTDPLNGDTDGDGLFDDEEIDGDYSAVVMEDNQTPAPRAAALAGVILNPLSGDTDGDGLADLFEIRYGLDPTDDGTKVPYANYTGLTVATTGANPNGPNGDPDGDGFVNSLERDFNSSPIDPASKPASRTLTFQVDLRQEIAKTPATFNPTNNGIEVRGSFNAFAGGLVLSNTATNGVYSGSFVVNGSSNAPINYKFYGTLTNGTTPVALEYEPNEDRLYTLKGDQVNETLPLVVFGDNISTRQVTFSVNMSVQEVLGRFTPGTDKVYLVGDVVGGWDPGVEMSRVGSTSVYTLTRAVTGVAGINLSYKFRAGNSLGYEIDLDAVATGDQPRTLSLGTRDVAQTVTEAYFNNVSVAPANRTVTFAVNMNIQTNANKLVFDPAKDFVELRGDFNFFGGGTDWRLTNNGAGIYTRSFVLTGNEGVTNAYKYVAVIVTATNTNSVWERVDMPRTNELANRTFVLGATNTNQVVHSVASPALFSDDDGAGPTDVTLFPAAIAENNSLGATVGVLSSTGDTTVGDTHTYSLVAGAGDTDNGSFSITGSDLKIGVVADYESPKTSYSVRVRSTDAYGNTLERVLTIAVTDVEETSPGSSFSGWLGSNAASAALVQQYAFGALSPSNAVNRSNLPSGGVIGSNLTLTYYVRSEATNPNLVVPQVHTNLADSNAWAAVDSNSITTLGTNTVDGVEVIQKRATVPVDGTRKFLRLKIAE